MNLFFDVETIPATVAQRDILREIHAKRKADSTPSREEVTTGRQRTIQILEKFLDAKVRT